jgi:hypothetical protein
MAEVLDGADCTGTCVGEACFGFLTTTVGTGVFGAAIIGASGAADGVSAARAASCAHTRPMTDSATGDSATGSARRDARPEKYPRVVEEGI